MYSVDGQRFHAGQPELQLALAGARDQHIRPVCLCAEPSTPLYVARLGTTFVLKRMPLTGSQHAIACPHYGPPPVAPQLNGGREHAVPESLKTGITYLRANFSLAQSALAATARAQSIGGEISEGNVARLSLSGLLHYLWREAELTKWRPAFEGKRSWAVVRAHLLDAASNKAVNGKLLGDALYVPETFTVARAESIRERRAARFNEVLGSSSQSQARKMLIVAELKSILAARAHFKVVMKHLPDMGFVMSNDLHRRITRQFGLELALRADNPECHLIVGATFRPTNWGQPAIDETCLFLATAQWIPFSNDGEKHLIDRLVFERHTFDRSLSVNDSDHPRRDHRHTN